MKFLVKKLALLLLVLLSADGSLADQSISYTYNTQGQVLSEDGPRTDVTDVTSYTYDVSGNRATLTNALSQVVHYNSYDGAGRLLSVTDINGITTELTYHDRGWLLTSTIKHPTTASLNVVTTYGYDAVGQLTSMTLPNSYSLQYEYDDARRLKAISNASGERIEYTLDAAGNRTQQTIKNNAGTITYSIVQAFDELSRVISVTGNHSQNDKHQYDANDNHTAVIDGRNNKTQQTYDALNRVAKIIDPNLKETQFTYDTQNRIKTVTDARSNTTSYQYDGLGNLLSQISPDTGTTTFTYDAAGNRTSVTDARSIVVNYTYDVLNRLTSVNYPATPAENVIYAYDGTTNGSYGKGRLASVTTAAARHDYVYNYMGLISAKYTQIGNTLTTTQYTYDLAGNLTGIIYPSGRLLTYVRDTAGRVTSVSTRKDAQATAQTLLSSISYLPFGPATTYTFGNGLSHTTSYDSDYRLTSIQVGGVLSRGYSYDVVDNITGVTNLIASTKSQTFSYDPLNRLNTVTGIYGTFGYTYDAVGNRLTETGNGANATYTYETLSNRLTGITKAGANRSFTYDAVGNRTQGISADNKAQTYTYNNANRLSNLKVNGTLTGTYSYNALGQRISKILAGNVQELYHYDETGQLIAISDAAGTTQREYLYNGNQLIGFINVANTAPIAPINLPAAGASFQGSHVLSTTQTGYTGATGFIDFVGEGQANWPLTITTTASYMVSVRYSLSGTPDRPLALLVDGVQKATFNFPATANWNTWTLATATLTLSAGSHTLSLKTTGKSGPNVDKVDIAAVAGQGGPSTDLYYVHNDHLGTPQVVTAQNQSVVWIADYQPFGVLQANQSNSIELYSRFPGQYVDQESGLYYNYFRDYDPSIGRYIESDPIGLAGGINTYAYVEGNSINWTDPLGLYHCVGGANCGFTEPMQAALACYDTCTGHDTAITGGVGNRSRPNSSHARGEACDVNRAQNPDVTPELDRTCHLQCFPQGYGQQEQNSDRNDEHTHYHHQLHTVPGGTPSYSPVIQPYTP